MRHSNYASRLIIMDLWILIFRVRTLDCFILHFLWIEYVVSYESLFCPKLLCRMFSQINRVSIAKANCMLDFHLVIPNPTHHFQLSLNDDHFRPIRRNPSGFSEFWHSGERTTRDFTLLEELSGTIIHLKQFAGNLEDKLSWTFPCS